MFAYIIEIKIKSKCRLARKNNFIWKVINKDVSNRAANSHCVSKIRY